MEEQADELTSEIAYGFETRYGSSRLFLGRSVIQVRVIKKLLRRLLESSKSGKKLLFGRSIYSELKDSSNCGKTAFVIKNWKHLWIADPKQRKSVQIVQLLKRIDITPVNIDNFFYSIDWFKTIPYKKRISDNYTVDYGNIVNSSLEEKKKFLIGKNNDFSKDMIDLISALHGYYDRLCSTGLDKGKYSRAIEAVGSIFERPADTFFEGLQRILFINQFLWQTGHKLNGLGRLDMILIELYRNDIREGRLTKEQAYDYLEDFFCALHEYFHEKSSALIGDTGQIIILGGLNEAGEYDCNELTELFIKVSKDMKLPDPKVLLRCNTKMTDELLGLALECIATGIGAPLISNDDAVVPAMISCGYDAVDAYNYATAACWEPLIPDSSCDKCNIASFNFAIPLLNMLDEADLDSITSTDDVLRKYRECLENYARELLLPLTKLEYEEDPLLSLLSDTSLNNQCDIAHGGAKYHNLGLTSIGMGTVVNSILNIQDIVFTQKSHTLRELADACHNDFAQNEGLRRLLKKRIPCYGCDDNEVIELTKQIMDMASTELKKYNSGTGGVFKMGLSAPSYISAGKNTGATPDGRKSGEPFSVHISSANPIPATELIHFAMQLDYIDNRINGNVIDFIVSPDALKRNFKKYLALLKSGLKGGIYQLQMNVVSSSTLIAAKENPELYPNLVVRVWGFSAYFNDLLDEYKDVLITRALESENAT